MLQYLDLDIAIQPRNGDAYPFTLNAPGGDARGELRLPDDLTFQQQLARLAALDTDEVLLTAVGRRLYAALFQGQARDVLVRTQGMLGENERLRVRLEINAEEGKVAALPWELLDDPDRGPLVLFDTPIVRYVPASARQANIAAPLPLRILLTGAQSASLAIDTVIAEVSAALSTLGSHAIVTVEPHLTLPIFQRRLREGYHVWHFIGQGGLSEAQAGVLLFEDGAKTKPVSASQLAVLLGSSGVRLVVLDASAGLRLATDPFRTIAPALIKTQIPIVVAAQFSVPAASSQAFAGEFYRALVEGLPIDTCVTEGRRAVMGSAGLDRLDWATPTVYSRAPDSQLFQVPAADIAGQIVTLGGAPGAPPNTSVRISSVSGVILNAGPSPLIERLGEKPRPPRPLRAFLNREKELRALLAELQPRQGAWVRGELGAGISALLRQAANTDTTRALPDGVVTLHSTLNPADADDAVQELFDRFYTSSVPVKLPPDAVRTYLGGLRALFIFDRLPLPVDQLMALADTLAEGAVLIAAEGRAPDTLLDVALAGLPRQEATRLIGVEAQAEIDLSNVVFLDRICAALDDLPLPLQLAGRMLRTRVITLKQLVAATEQPRTEPLALARIAAIALQTLDEAELAVLAAAVRVGPAGATAEAISAVSQVESPRLDAALDKLCELRLIEGGSDRFGPTTAGLARVLDRLLKPGDQKRRAAVFFASAALAHAGQLDWLQAEEGNLFQAIETLLHDGKTAEAGKLIKATQPLEVLHGHWGAWGQLITYAERAGTNDAALRAWAAHERGARAGLLGNHALATTSLQAARALRSELGDAPGAAATTHALRHFGLLPVVAAGTPHHVANRTNRRPNRVPVLIAVISAVALLLALLGWNQGLFATRSSAQATESPLLIIAATSIPTERTLSTAVVTTTRPPLPPTAAPTGTPTDTPTAMLTPEPPTCRVIAARVNLRSGPGTNYSVQQVLTDGVAVTPIGRSSDAQWLHVRAADQATGWASADPGLLTCNVDLATLQLSIAPPSPTSRPRPRPTARPTARPPLRPTAAPALPTVLPEPPTVPPEPPTMPPELPAITPAPPTATPAPASASSTATRPTRVQPTDAPTQRPLAPTDTPTVEPDRPLTATPTPTP